MKSVRTGIFLLVAALLCGPLPADAQDARSAEAFVTQLYQRYHTQKDFSPFADLPTVNTIATPALAALVKQEQKASAAADDEGAMDSDPLSGSQDSEGLQVAGLKIEPAGSGKAVADVTLRFQTERVLRRLFLVAVNGQWRIDNITDEKGHDDLRAKLARSLAAHAPGHQH